MKIKDRLYHCVFGWCVVYSPIANDKVLVNLEVDEVEYYVMGKGYVKFKRERDGKNTLLTPIEELFESDQNIPERFRLQKLCANPKLTFYKKTK